MKIINKEKQLQKKEKKMNIKEKWRMENAQKINDVRN